MYFLPVAVVSSAELTDSDGGADSRPEAEAGEERSVETRVNAAYFLDLVMRDAVKRQHAGLLVQINPDAFGFGSVQCGFFPIMPHGEGLSGPVEAPGLCVVTQSSAVVGCRALHVLICHADRHLKRANECHETKGRNPVAVNYMCDPGAQRQSLGAIF